MGAGASKPTDGSQHVFASETPVQFSQELVDSLQLSPESDGSRAQDLEKIIQRRVADELSKISKREDRLLSEIESKLASEEISTPSSSSSSSTSQEEGPVSSALSSVLPGSKTDETKKKDLRRESVLKEIESLKQKLGQRKQLKEVDQEVEKAKQDVVSCLRLNDRRPLDCWKEVQTFKAEVAKMESKFVEKVMN